MAHSHTTKSANAIDRHVGTRLAIARKMAGLSQGDAAGALGITFQQVQKYEHGANRISAGKLALLAKLYGRPIGWFFEGAPLQDRPPAEAAENDDALARFLTTPHAMDLMRYFPEIGRNADRAAVLDVVRSLACAAPAAAEHRYRAEHDARCA